MNTQEMRKTTCKPGYWFVNIAKIGDAPNWVQQPMPVNDSGKLFGYDERAFMRRQYK